jgi:hypothetical protein
MDTNSVETALPDDKEALEKIRLKQEIRELRENTFRLRQERGWNIPKMLTLTLAIFTGVSPVIFTALNYRQEVQKYVDTQEREQTFRVSEEVIKLFRDLSSEDPKKERIAALALASYGRAALPFLTEHLNIDHNIVVFSTIIRSIRLITNEAPDQQTGESYIKFIFDELQLIAENNLDIFLDGELLESEMLEAQFRTLGVMAVDTKYSTKYREKILDTLRVYKKKILNRQEKGKLPLAENLISIINFYLNT